MVKNSPPNAGDRRDRGSIPGQEDALEEGMETDSSILAWRFPWTTAVGLQSVGSQRVGHDRSNFACRHIVQQDATWQHKRLNP